MQNIRKVELVLSAMEKVIAWIKTDPTLVDMNNDRRLKVSEFSHREIAEMVRMETFKPSIVFWEIFFQAVRSFSQAHFLGSIEALLTLKEEFSLFDIYQESFKTGNVGATLAPVLSLGNEDTVVYRSGDCGLGRTEVVLTRLADYGREYHRSLTVKIHRPQGVVIQVNNLTGHPSYEWQGDYSERHVEALQLVLEGLQDVPDFRKQEIIHGLRSTEGYFFENEMSSQVI